MQRDIKQLLLSLFMGLVMPALALRWGLPQQQSLPTQSQSQATTQPQAVCQVAVWRDGSAQMLELEEYVAGVVLAEMPADFAVEALKAQAVAARTVALRSSRLGNRHPGNAICTDPGCCQAYIPAGEYLAQGGAQANVDKVLSAVADTAGQVLTYQGELIEAVYFSCSGGTTEDAVAVWGNDVPYLQSVASPGEEHARHYWDSIRFSVAEFSAALGRDLTGSPGSWFGSVTYTTGGGVSTMVIAGRSYTGTQLRQLLGLNSTVFSMEISGSTITVFTRGKGHRVGMSQYGADAMALSGKDYTQILTYYYQGVRIDKIEALG